MERLKDKLKGSRRQSSTRPKFRRRTVSRKIERLLLAFSRHLLLNPHTLLFAVWDNDHNKEQGPLRERDELHIEIKSKGDKGFVAAVCVEEIEAWLLADAKSFEGYFGQPMNGLPAKPEEVTFPKEYLKKLVRDELNASLDRNDYYELARHIDLKVLVQKCPAGYAQFREDMSELIVPCLNESKG